MQVCKRTFYSIINKKVIGLCISVYFLYLILNIFLSNLLITKTPPNAKVNGSYKYTKNTRGYVKII